MLPNYINIKLSTRIRNYFKKSKRVYRRSTTRTRKTQYPTKTIDMTLSNRLLSEHGTGVIYPNGHNTLSLYISRRKSTR